MKFSLFDALTINCRIDSVLAENIETACDKLRITKAGRKRVAQAAATGAVDRDDLNALIESAPGLIVEPGSVRALSMPLAWKDLIGHFRYDS